MKTGLYWQDPKYDIGGTITDPSLVLHLPLHRLDGASFMSRDAYGHLYTNHGSLWTPRGRSFDGLDDYINCGIMGYNWTGKDWTVIAWALLNAGISDAYRGIVGIRFGAGAANWWSLGTSTVNIRVELSGSPSPGYVESGFAPKGKGWKQYAVHKSGTLVTILIDALDNGNHDIAAANIGGTTNDLYLGRWYAANQIWDGLIGEVWFYSRALTPQEIQHNYLATKWRYR